MNWKFLFFMLSTKLLGMQSGYNHSPKGQRSIRFYKLCNIKMDPCQRIQRYVENLGNFQFEEGAIDQETLVLFELNPTKPIYYRILLEKAIDKARELRHHGKPFTRLITSLHIPHGFFLHPEAITPDDINQLEQEKKFFAEFGFRVSSENRVFLERELIS